MIFKKVLISGKRAPLTRASLCISWWRSGRHGNQLIEIITRDEDKCTFLSFKCLKRFSVVSLPVKTYAFSISSCFTSLTKGIREICFSKQPEVGMPIPCICHEIFEIIDGIPKSGN